MRNRTILITMALCCFIFTSCVETKSPLSSPQDAKLDEKVLGVWRGADDDGNVEYLHINKTRFTKMSGWFEAIQISQKENRVVSLDIFYGFTTYIDGKTFINFSDIPKNRLKALELAGTDEVTSKTFVQDVKSYTIMKVECDESALSLWASDSEYLKKAIKAGRLKGKARKVTDSTENLRKFFAKEADGLFPEKDGKRVIYKRLR